MISLKLTCREWLIASRDGRSQIENGRSQIENDRWLSHLIKECSVRSQVGHRIIFRPRPEPVRQFRDYYKGKGIYDDFCKFSSMEEPKLCQLEGGVRQVCIQYVWAVGKVKIICFHKHGLFPGW